MFRLVLLSALVALVAGRAPHVVPIVPMLDGRIVGGEPTTIEQYPYQLSLETYGSHGCGASIISPNRALTAAHCTSGSSASALAVRAGSTYRGSGGVVAKVQSICQHPSYNPRNIDNDVSVLRLAIDLPTGTGMRSIPLVRLGGAPAAGTLATVSGWGTLSSGGSLPVQLQRVQVPRVSQADCRSAYGQSRITDNMICFGYLEGGKDSCQGDSGGPLVTGGNQVGVVSWGAGCATARFPGVYADVAVASIRNHITQC